MKIYTKTGDDGRTSLIGGTRVPKYHIRIECYGTVDELCSWIGLIRDQDIHDSYKSLLIEIQDRLFTIESLLAQEEDSDFALPKLEEKDLLMLEKEIDELSKHIPKLKSFLLPGGNVIVSYCHIARTICRRAERLILKLKTEFEVDDLIIKYLNRLSDYLFVLSRKISVDKKATETLWKPRV